MNPKQNNIPARWRAEVTAVIPCYNAGARVRPVVQGVLQVLEHVIVVDDGCTDGCMISLEDLPILVVSLPQNQGKGHALLAGFRKALERPGTKAVCVVDADGQHDPGEISKLLRAWEEQYGDLVIGARVFQRGQVPWGSWIGNQATRLLTALLVRRRLPDTQCGFRVLSRAFIEDILEAVPGGRYEMEMEILIKAIRDGRNVVSTPIATLYEPGNPSSHFHKVRDSILVYARLMRSVFARRR